MWHVNDRCKCQWIHLQLPITGLNTIVYDYQCQKMWSFLIFLCNLGYNIVKNLNEQKAFVCLFLAQMHLLITVTSSPLQKKNEMWNTFGAHVKQGFGAFLYETFWNIFKKNVLKPCFTCIPDVFRIFHMFPVRELNMKMFQNHSLHVSDVKYSKFHIKMFQKKVLHVFFNMFYILY